MAKQELMNPTATSNEVPSDDSTVYDSDSNADDDYLPQKTVSGGISLPCVIPQTTKATRGAFYSPFVRGYIPELEAHNISQSDFLTFIDGMNECFVPHPVFEGLGVVGGVLSMVQGTGTVEIVGASLQVASGMASAATSYTRTRAFVKAMNQDLFNPAGLHVNVLTTKKMMAKVHYPEDRLKLPPVETITDIEGIEKMKAKEAAKALSAQSSEQDDPRMRRIRALEGYVMPLDLDVPEATPPDNMLRKMSAARAAKMNRKQSAKLEKERSKGQRLYIKRSRGAEKAQDRKDSRLAEIEEEMAKNEAELEKELAGIHDEKGQRKARKRHEKEQAKLTKRMEKVSKKSDRIIAKRTKKAEKGQAKMDRGEDKIAHKIRWIVVSRYEDRDDSDEDSLPGSENDGEKVQADEKGEVKFSELSLQEKEVAV